ncbi:MAG: hypothetical protein CFH01_00662 [Alphaproteobacteria bacterium MarineAlpha2_Bin1]|nr:hypothetical protein [Rhodospirillaceae bacterium]PPR79005.1 MAG: hypothetical protein CFH01_00662 [Alphaproteobacteria bacterium MarineAlpha2_Bin1]|tara:strand:+ start:137 stop:1057 length:921 start_codon:yes stop_codon:yes gene_type:complete
MNENIKNSSSVIPFLLLVLGAIIYGSFFSAQSIALKLGVSPLGLAFWQGFLGAIILIFFSLLFREMPKFSWDHVRLYSSISLFAFSIPLIAVSFAAPHVPPGILGLIVTLVPSLTYLFAFLAKLEKFNWLSTSGLAFGLAGVVIIVFSTNSIEGSFSGTWFIIALIAPLGYAASNTAVALIRPAEATTIQLSTGVLCFSVPILLIPMLFVDGFYFFKNTDYQGFSAVLWAGITNIVIFITLFEVIYRRGPVFFSQFNYITPAAALLWAYLIFSENIPFIVWFAIILMIIGLYLANRGTALSLQKGK